MNVCLIGAGAIARQSYLPFFHKSRRFHLTAVVERNEAVLADLVPNGSMGYVGPDLRKGLEQADAAIVCVPNHLHYPIAKQCLTSGKHVLCEKPLCTRVSDGEDLLVTARHNRVVLSVSQVRRFYPAAKAIRDMITHQSLGALKHFDFREGTVFSWPTVTGFVFDREKAGGGVLMDIGVHLLDLLFWWMGDDIASFDYADDNQGGVEATAEIRLSFNSGVDGKIKLTRLSPLRNAYTFHFENGMLAWNPLAPQRLYIRKNGASMTSKTMGKGNPFEELLFDFYEAVTRQRPPFVRGEEALRVLRFMESCYAARRAIPMPWMDAGGPLT